MSRLSGKTALVTGGSRGIGRAIAIGLACEGASVVVNYANDEVAADATVKEIEMSGGSAKAIQCDIRDPKAVDQMINEALEQFGRIDTLINNAGVLSRISFLELDHAEFSRIIETNVNGVFHVSHCVAKQMIEQGGGIILNISSIGAHKSFPNASHYCTSKAAVSMLTQCMALELAPFKIRVNELRPGLIETDMNSKDLANPEFRASRIKGIPMGRLGQESDLVEAAIYLCSDSSSWTTGAAICIDGGTTVSP
jgi:NAD(P)-dependent dehydrogenase (short-subunit alcohol dehydrogenase family)